MDINKTTIEEFERWLQHLESKNLEFKTAKSTFNENKDLPDYCAAIANEGGGKLILGVDPSRNIVGTAAFQGTHNTLSNKLLSSLGIRIDVEELK